MGPLQGRKISIFVFCSLLEYRDFNYVALCEQMIWEQGSTVIINLSCLVEDTVPLCHRYWPETGSDLYHIYEASLFIVCLTCFHEIIIVNLHVDANINQTRDRF